MVMMMMARCFSFAVMPATGIIIIIIIIKKEEATIDVSVPMKMYLKTHGNQHYVILQVDLIKAPRC